MRTLLLAGVAAIALVGVTETANAAGNIIRTFYSPGGSSGILDPADGSEPWTYGSFTPILNASGVSTTDVGWGSPGVSRGYTAYNGPGSASDFEITFATATLDFAQIAQGMAMGCAGSEGGGTTFCGPNGQWAATSWTANSITFTGPPGTDMKEGQDYFVNIMLLDGGSGSGFNGAWTGTIPEPATWAMMLMGFAGLGYAGYRKARPAISAGLITARNKLLESRLRAAFFFARTTRVAKIGGSTAEASPEGAAPQPSGASSRNSPSHGS
jgi:PEP-CTERM motif